jgi:chromosome segregation ATPase
MDAEYRERTNVQLKEMVVDYESQIKNWQRQGAYYGNNQEEEGNYPGGLKQSLRRYEKLLDEADSERVGLLNEITLLSKENYQLRVELSSKDAEGGAEAARELAAELEQERSYSRALQEESEELKREIIDVEGELNEKNKKIRLLTLNLNRKEFVNNSFSDKR